MPASQGNAQAIIPDKVDPGIPLATLLKLRSQNLSYDKIAERVGCSKQNVHERLRRHINFVDNNTEFKDNRADILAVHQQMILQSIDYDDIKKMPVGSRYLALCQLYDKERLERGLSTQNIDSHVVTAKIEQVRADLDRIQKRRLQLQGVKPNDNDGL